MRNRRTVVLMVLVMMVAGFSVARARAYEGGAATPEELAERFKLASAKEDFGEMAACLAPEDRAGMSLGLVLASGMMTAMGGFAAEMGEGFAEAFAESSEGEEAEDEPSEANAEMAAMRKKSEEIALRLEAILDKYGVTEMVEKDAASADQAEGADPEAAMIAAFADVDQIGLIRDLGVLLKEIGMEKSEDGGAEGEHGSMVEEGFENLEIEGDRGTATFAGEPVELMRIDGRWFLHQPADAVVD